MRADAPGPNARHSIHMLVRLTRKLAEYFNGVDLRQHAVGDEFELPYRAADALIDAGWAEVIERRGQSDRRASRRTAQRDISESDE